MSGQMYGRAYDMMLPLKEKIIKTPVPTRLTEIEGFNNFQSPINEYQVD